MAAIVAHAPQVKVGHQQIISVHASAVFDRHTAVQRHHRFARAHKVCGRLILARAHAQAGANRAIRGRQKARTARLARSDLCALGTKFYHDLCARHRSKHRGRARCALVLAKHGGNRCAVRGTEQKLTAHRESKATQRKQRAGQIRTRGKAALLGRPL